MADDVDDDIMRLPIAAEEVVRSKKEFNRNTQQAAIRIDEGILRQRSNRIRHRQEDNTTRPNSNYGEMVRYQRTQAKASRGYHSSFRKNNIFTFDVLL